MKIIHIITALGIGGAEKLLSNIVNTHCARHEIIIIYLKGAPLVAADIDSKVKIFYIELNLQSAKKIRNFIKIEKPDIVHTHLGHADLIGLWAARKLNVQQVCTMHNIWFKFNILDYILFFIYRLLFSTVSAKCKVICISQAVADHVRNRLNVKPQNIILLYNGIPQLLLPLSKNEIRQKLKIVPNQFVVLFVGRLEIQKNVETLIKAIEIIAPKIINLKCLIIGDGSKREELKEIINNKNLYNVISLEGIKPDPTLYFSASDVFVLPSVFEGLGIVILEAFRACLPVIASNVEGPKELIQHYKNGLLFEPQDHNQLAKHILEIYTNNLLRTNLGKNGYQTFKDNFDITKYTDQLEQIYLTQ